MGDHLLNELTERNHTGSTVMFRLRVAVGGIGLFLVTFTLCLAAWATAPTILPGWSAFVVQSGSMQPALDVGDVVVTRPAGVEVLTGTVVVFDIGLGATVHRVVSETQHGLITQGDANPERDSTPVPVDIIQGSGAIRVPWIGLPSLWLGTGHYGKFIAFIAAELIALMAVAIAIPAARSFVSGAPEPWPCATFGVDDELDLLGSAQ